MHKSGFSPSRRARFATLWLVGGMMLAFAAVADSTQVSVGNASTNVLNGRAATLSFPVTRSGDSSYALTIGYTTQDGSAIAGTDYTATSGITSIPAGAISTTISVPVTGESGSMPDKQMSLRLQSAAYAPGLYNSGASFATQQNFDTSVIPHDAIAVDINGDGRPDLVEVGQKNAAPFDAYLSVLMNTTAPGATVPSYATAQLFPAGTVPNSLAMSVSAADINGDGRPDLVITDNAVLYVLLNTTAPGSASASFSALQALAGGATSVRVYFADINGDGLPDLVATNSGIDLVSVLLNTTVPGAANASFTPPQHFATGRSPRVVAVVDVNGDGRPDLLVPNSSSNTVSVLLNTTAPGSTTASFASQPLLTVGSFPLAIAAADINGDGRPDMIVTPSNPGAVMVLLNNTAPGATTTSFAAPQTVSGLSAVSVAAADVNGDGRPDLLLTDKTGSGGQVLLNTTVPGATTVSFYRSGQVLGSTPTSPSTILAADVNGDGQPDLVTAGGNYFAVVINTTASVVPPNFASQQAFGTGSNPKSVNIADFNGDGRPDLATANVASNTLSVLFNTTAPGATTPGFSPQQSFATGNHPYGLTSADLNGDGRPDLVATNSGDGTVSVLLNTAAPGSSSPGFATQQTFATGSGPVSVAAVDVNGDGRRDLLVANSASNTVSVLLNTTAPGAAVPAFAAQQTFATGSQPYSVSAADVNGDGLPDLLVANYGDGTVSVLLNTTAPGATTPSYAAQQVFAVGSGPDSIIAVDLNCDGRPDLVVTNSLQGTVSVLFNTTTPGATVPAFAGQQTFVSGNESYAVTAADVNGDGLPDLVVADRADRQVSVLFNTTVPGAATPSFAMRQVFATEDLPQSIGVADLNGDGRPDLVAANGAGNSVAVLLNTQYWASASATAGTGTIHYFATPPAPTNLSAVSGLGKITLNWTGTPNANNNSSSYYIYQSTTPGGEAAPAVQVVYAPNTSALIAGLSNGTQYYFKVKAVNPAGSGPYSNEATATPGGPLPPANVTATPGAGIVTLNWVASANADSYYIYQSSTSGGEAPPALLVVSGGSSTSVVISGLTSGNTYYFKIKSHNSIGSSAYSNEASATIGLPAAPTGVTATPGIGLLSLHWNASANTSSYYIYQSTTAGGEAPPAVQVVSGGGSTSATIGGLSNGSTYFFKIKALNSAGSSPYSNEASATVGLPAPPTNVAATAGSGSVTLHWTAAANTSSYYVYQSTSAGGEAPPAVRVVPGGSSTGSTITGLSSGTAYFFKVKSLNSAGSSAFSNEASATPN